MSSAEVASAAFIHGYNAALRSIMKAGSSPHLIVLDVLVPFRTAKVLQTLPDEDEAIHSRVLAAQKVRHSGAAIAQLLTAQKADGIWLQANRQDPRHPVVQAKPHLLRHVGATDSGMPAPGVASAHEQASGASDQIVMTVHLPKGNSPRSTSELAASAAEVANLMSGSDWVQQHCQARGYRTLSAHGQEYDDLAAVRHNSFALLIAAATVVEVITVVEAVVIWILSEPSITSFRPTSSVGRTTVTIDGQNFENGMTVAFNGQPISYAITSRSEITTDLLPNVPGALIDPTVRSPAQSPFAVTTSIGSATSIDTFILTPLPPTITDFIPLSGPPGTAVDISGSGFDVSGLTVQFNGVSADSVTVVSDSQVTAVVPAASGQGPIQVSTSGGDASSASDFTQL